nr:ribonuclease H-like domain-containing protein [Tanacetum cinerariifolium]
MQSQSETTQTVSALKLPVLKTGEYDLWSMRMEQYLTLTDHAIWELARTNKLKAKSTLMLAIPDEHLLKFHACKDAKSLWEAIKNSQEGIDKTYDRFQKLISQLEIHGEVISQEDANMKLLRSLPSAWNNIALIMGNKSNLDTLSMDDLYNNLKEYKSEIKGQSSSSSNSHNVAFVSSDNTSGTNETINIAHSVFVASSKDQASTGSYADDVMFSFFFDQSNALQLDNEDLKQIDTDDLEEMDLKWQVEMLTMRVKRFIKKIIRKLDLNGKETVSFDRTKVRCYNYHRRGHFARECRAPRNQENRNRDAPTRNAPVDASTTNALVAQDGIGLESLEARIVIHEKNEAVYEEDITFLKYDVQVNDISIKEIKNQLENALKEKDDLKLKLEKVETSSKNLTKLINTQLSAIDKTGLGYDGQMNEIDLNDIHVNESEVLNRVFDSNESDEDDNEVSDRFKKAAVLTKSRQVPLNAAKQSSNRATTSVTAAKRVNIVASRPNDNPQYALHDQGIFYSGFSRHMTGNKSYLTDYQEINGGFVAFGGNAKGGKNTRKYKISLLFTDTECVVLSPDFKLLDESRVLLKVPRNNNMYSFDLKNVIPIGGLTCLFAKSTLDESNLWHRRLGHINFKTINKLVRGNLVRGLALKLFKNDHTYVACQKGKQHKASCKTKTGTRRELSVTRTPQQNSVAERKNRTLIEAARTMLADSKLPTTFWAEAVNLVIKPHNKTPYELFLGYSINSKAFRVFNTRTRFVEENLHINFLENKPNVTGTGPNWMFDIDTLTMSMNYQPVFAGNQTNGNAGTKANIDAGQDKKKTIPGPQYVLLPLLTSDSQGPKSSENEVADDAGKKTTQVLRKENGEEKEHKGMYLKDTIIFSGVYDDEVEGVVADFNNLKLTTVISPISKTRIHKDHPKEQIIEDPLLALQTRRMTKTYQEHAMVSYIKKQRRTNHKDYQNCLLACFLLQIEPKNVIQALTDLSWIEAISMIGSLMYLTASRPDIMFAVCACARFQVTPKVSHLHAMKRIFRYLKCQPKLGLWYPRDSPFYLEDFSDSDYAGASLDRKSITGEMALVMNLELKLVVTKVSTAEQKLVLNGCLDWNETTANDEIEVSDVDLTYYCSTMASAIICLATNQKFNSSKHNVIFVISSKTKKVFANMKREGKDFSGKVTPVFETMMVQAPEDMGEDSELLTDSYHTPIVTQPSSSPPQKKQKSRRKQRKEIKVPSPSSEIPNEECVPTTSNDPLPSGEDRMQLNELMILCTNLQKQVLDLEEAKTAQAKEIASLKKRIKKLEQKRKSRTSGLKRLRKVGSVRRIESSTEASLASEKVEQSVKVVEKEVSTADPVTTAGEVVTTAELVKGSDKVVEGSEKAEEGSSKIAANDDVTIEATPLSSKSPTIVDYKIYKEWSKSFFKIIRAYGNSQNYLTFGKMFKNFNREDSKVLWSIVKARFKKTKPIDDMDNLLFQTLKTMFEHHVEDNIWKYQQGTVKWKLRLLRDEDWKYAKELLLTPWGIKGGAKASSRASWHYISSLIIISPFAKGYELPPSLTVSSAKCVKVSRDMLLIPSLSIKKLNLSLGKGLVKLSAS